MEYITFDIPWHFTAFLTVNIQNESVAYNFIGSFCTTGYYPFSLIFSKRYKFKNAITSESQYGVVVFIPLVIPKTHDTVVCDSIGTHLDAKEFDDRCKGIVLSAVQFEGCTDGAGFLGRGVLSKVLRLYQFIVFVENGQSNAMSQGMKTIRSARLADT